MDQMQLVVVLSSCMNSGVVAEVIGRFCQRSVWSCCVCDIVLLWCEVPAHGTIVWG